MALAIASCDKDSEGTGTGGGGTTAEYVDLGLPSGTKWKTINERGHYSFDYARRTFNNNLPTTSDAGKLPTEEQFKELINKCQWSWSYYGYMVTGPNDNVIFLPASGISDPVGNVEYHDKQGGYWSSTYYRLLFIYEGGVYMTSNMSDRYSVRLVQNP